MDVPPRAEQRQRLSGGISGLALRPSLWAGCSRRAALVRVTEVLH